MVVVPAAMPVTMPDASIVPAAGVPLLQVPPGTVLLNVMVAPAHTADGPVIVPAVSGAATFTVLLLTAVPQPLVTVYRIVSRPGVSALTTPLPLIAAIDGLVMPHMPPGVGPV